jgi:hypothetical protein
MNFPKIPVETKPFIWGAVIGAIALAVVGFNWGGWVTGGTSDKIAEGRADKAVANALAPVCIAQFRNTVNAPAMLKTFKALNSWEQGDYVGKGGWATMPGSVSKEPNGQVVSACVEALNKLVL